MSRVLSTAKTKMGDLLEVEKYLDSYQVEFKNFSLDYLVITFYADFEKELNRLIENKLKSGGDFSKNYCLFIKNRYKQLHGGIKKGLFKDLTEKVFQKEINCTDKDWQIYCSFVSFRNSIAHDDNYEVEKAGLLGNIQGDVSKILTVLEKYINILSS